MRLTSTIIAAFLALSMAIFPISMVRAAAVGGHNHAGIVESAEHGDHHGDIASADADCALVASSHHHTTPPDDGSSSAPSCCGMGACHAFQMSSATGMSTPAAVAHLLHAPGDEQVTGAFLGRIDRPPRPV